MNDQTQLLQHQLMEVISKYRVTHCLEDKLNVLRVDGGRKMMKEGASA